VQFTPEQRAKFIINEAIAALDADIEAQIQSHLNAIRGVKTQMLIARKDVEDFEAARREDAPTTVTKGLR
jgi:hypothetical protein